MNWQESVAQGPGSTTSDLFDGGFSWGLVLIGFVALLALTAVCTFGILARVRDRAADRKSLEALHRAVQPAIQPAERAIEPGGSGPSGGNSTLR
jgi:hypothetical protein